MGQITVEKNVAGIEGLYFFCQNFSPTNGGEAPHDVNTVFVSNIEFYCLKASESTVCFILAVKVLARATTSTTPIIAKSDIGKIDFKPISCICWPPIPTKFIPGISCIIFAPSISPETSPAMIKTFFLVGIIF